MSEKSNGVIRIDAKPEPINIELVFAYISDSDFTGGARGIGRAIVTQFVRSGADASPMHGTGRRWRNSWTFPQMCTTGEGA
jgi:hypothetical protein